MVRGIAAVLLTAALLAAPMNTTSAETKLCDVGDAQAIIESGPIGGRQSLIGFETDRVESWERCQFRLYEPPHTLSTRDWMVGGVFSGRCTTRWTGRRTTARPPRSSSTKSKSAFGSVRQVEG